MKSNQNNFFFFCQGLKVSFSDFDIFRFYFDNLLFIVVHTISKSKDFFVCIHTPCNLFAIKSFPLYSSHANYALPKKRSTCHELKVSLAAVELSDEPI